MKCKNVLRTLRGSDLMEKCFSECFFTSELVCFLHKMILYTLTQILKQVSMSSVLQEIPDWKVAILRGQEKSRAHCFLLSLHVCAGKLLPAHGKLSNLVEIWICY